ncbi:MAG: L-seryl-tRNA(Sec) selenium transferase [Firmicutes bacterium]|nr:L-seryl-tRNA(Sec) selenium transferase [Bacillota bacterium]
MKSPTKNELLRQLPKVDDLQKIVFAKSVTNFPHALLTDAIREVISMVRSQITKGERNDMPDTLEFVQETLRVAASYLQCNLRSVINATGIVLHTNLGRSPLAKKVAEVVKQVAENYSTLEYNTLDGKRGSRYTAVDELICRLTGAEASMVVNNNAASVMLMLKALCESKEVIVSRGELVEIGGSFRVPDVMRESGAILKEVGTTNKTRASDYEKAIDKNKTAALLKVHTSNFKVIGFNEETTLEELSALGKKHNIPVLYDFGSGLFVDDAEEVGLIDELTVKQAFASNIDLIAFSCDKLMGGPQGGIIAGKYELIERIKKHPLTRILRIDKLRLAALEATLRLYLDNEFAKKEIPTLKMLSYTQDELKAKAKKLLKKINSVVGGWWSVTSGCESENVGMSNANPKNFTTKNVGAASCRPQNSTTTNVGDAAHGIPHFTATIAQMEGQVGGGSAPGQLLPSYGVEITPLNISINDLEEKLRLSSPPIITRIKKDKLLLDVRTIGEDQFQIIANALISISGGEK